jgi:alkanesulfonate monooxygenase SsuD/methylene tetrahydromethanopterin reductase-like flavin-dependent oxidoreductase (luciferase family)
MLDFGKRHRRGEWQAMRLGFFTMPMHRMGRPWAETLREDRETVILADRLGFYDAFVGEHLTDQLENIPNSMLFLASLISDTRTIKLATGTSNLSYMHPVLIASNAALLDTLAAGRFIFGISPGNIPSDAEVLGQLDQDRGKIFAEAIDVILEIWAREPPFDIDLPGNRFKVSTIKTSVPELGLGSLAKPFQKPRPEIVGTVVAPYSKGVVLMGERDFHPLSANFLMPRWVKTHWQNYAEGKAKVGRTADPADWRIARTVFVADDDHTALAYGQGPDSPFRFYYRQLKAKFDRARRTIVWKDDPNQPDDAITEDHVVERLVICGTVNKVVDQILALRAEVGEFGELVYAGMDWFDEALTKRSMQLMAEQVMPRVNAAIGRATAAQ